MNCKPLLLLFLYGLALIPAVAQEIPADESRRSQQRQAYVQAQQALENGDTVLFQQLRQQLADYPLLPYLEYAELSRALTALPASRVDEFLARNADSVLANRLQQQWLAVLVDSQQPANLMRYFNPATTSTELTCQVLKARLDAADSTALDEVAPLWNVAVSQPNTCDPVFAAWMQAGRLSPELGMQRLGKTLRAGELGLARFIARQLPAAEQSLAQTYLDIYQNPNHLSRLENFGANDSYTREIILHGLQRLSSLGNATAALELFQTYTPRHAFPESERLRTERYITQRLLYQGETEVAESLLQRSPELRSDELVEWLLRAALAEQDWSRLTTRLLLLPPESRNSERWRYWQARSLLQAATPEASAQAQAIYSELADSRSFYGFLAADALGQPYAFVDRPVQVSAEELQTVAQVPALERARELYLIDDTANALREWDFAMARLSENQLLAAGRLAANWGWHRNSIQAMIRASYWDDLQLRFPLVYQDSFAAAVDQHPVLDSHLVFAVARQESAFMPEVISPVGAMGLMQLMPATARAAATSAGLRITTQDLLKPDINIQLGSYYLAQLMQEFAGNRIVAAAAYNAGPNRVRQWLSRSEGTLPFDLWIETLPFAETRSYIQNVLAYVVIYAYLNGERVPFITAAEARRLL